MSLIHQDLQTLNTHIFVLMFLHKLFQVTLVLLDPYTFMILLICLNFHLSLALGIFKNIYEFLLIFRSL